MNKINRKGGAHVLAKHMVAQNKVIPDHSPAERRPTHLSHTGAK